MNQAERLVHNLGENYMSNEEVLSIRSNQSHSATGSDVINNSLSNWNKPNVLLN